LVAVAVKLEQTDTQATYRKEELMTDAFGSAEKKSGMRITWRGIVLIIIVFLLALFAVQNLNEAKVSFIGMDFDIFVWVIVTVSFLLGMLLGGVVRGTARKLRKPHPEVKK
jgi:uncharacterized integral membrane protein